MAIEEPDGGDPAFHDEEVCQRAKIYLDSWKRRSYGAIAGLISPNFAEATPSATAGVIRGEFESFQLDDYTLVAATSTPPLCARSTSSSSSTGSSDTGGCGGFAKALTLWRRCRM